MQQSIKYYLFTIYMHYHLFIIRRNQLILPHLKQTMSSNKLLSKKRQQFHSKIRSQYIHSYMSKVRYELHQQQLTASLHALNQLIQSTTSSIDINQLAQLVRYANNSDENNAIIHIGNLVIDGVVVMEDMLRCNLQLVPGESRYWLWLIRVILLETRTGGYNNSSSSSSSDNSLYVQWWNKAITYVMCKFVTAQHAFALTESLEIITHLISTTSSSPFQPSSHTIIINHLLSAHHGVLIRLKDCCLHFDKRVSELSYEVLDRIISEGDYPTVQLIKICSLPQIQRVLTLGFNKLDHGQKRFPLIICRMVNNICASGVRLSEGMLRAVINRGLSDGNSQRVRVEFSYLWLSFCEMCVVRELEVVLEWKLLDVLESLMGGSVDHINSRNNTKHSQTITNNISSILGIILEKSRHMNSQKTLQITNRIQLIAHQFSLPTLHTLHEHGQANSQYPLNSNNNNINSPVVIIGQSSQHQASQSGMDIQ